MDIREIIKDIFDDMDHEYDKSYQSYRDMGSWHRSAKKNAGSAALMHTLFPNIMGFLFGLAITRFLEFTGIAYLIFGIIGAVGIGVLYSVLKQGIALKYAVARHIIIVAGISIIFGIMWLIDSPK